ncbi:CASP-like protein 5B1 [Cynara cardunculus var. scolymus]|uniref:CASP-like protein 5B1 n=1 Tax=Cynara cardunculus var. scolymus TaxID=59895 RepID=UPI000D623815|nr:CASP-like protein 5B1 [Cynara cardunculus var. scolymus]XP_024990832.1 CASP-like protein 5B1 [Cynara cardunculus var. scolymus]
MMKPCFGTPGITSGLVLRIFQFLCAAASIAVMAASSGFSSATSFCYLIAAMGLEVLWSLGLACLDIHALWVKKDLQSQILLSLVVVGDWVTAILALAASSSSAGVMVLFVRDSELCKLEPILSCSMYQISIGLAFGAWFWLAISSHTVLWLLASLS